MPGLPGGAHKGAAPEPATSGQVAALRYTDRFPYLAVLGVPDALRHHLEEGPGRLGVAHGEVAEAPFGEHQAVQLRLSGDLRRTVPVGLVDECHLAEVVTAAENANGLPVHTHHRLPVHDDAEAHAWHVHVRYHSASGNRQLVPPPCELGHFLFRQHREQRDAGQDFPGRGHGPMLRPNHHAQAAGVLAARGGAGLLLSANHTAWSTSGLQPRGGLRQRDLYQATVRGTASRCGVGSRRPKAAWNLLASMTKGARNW